MSSPIFAPRRAAFAFVFVTVMLDMLALGLIIPVLPKLIESFMGGDTADAAKVYGVFATAWAALRAPVLAVYGEYDWFESADAHRLVADLANRRRAGQGRFVVIPATDHHFMRYPDRHAAYRGEDGTVNADAAADEMLRWLREVFDDGG